MKRWMWILCGLLAFCLIEETGAQVEKLQPMQLLQATKENGCICLRTDTKEFGKGNTMLTAMRDLQDTAEKKIFLETADMLLLGENTEMLLPELRKLLRPAVQVCRVRGGIDLSQAALYLQNHSSNVTIGRMTAFKELPELKEEGGRLRLAETNR